MNTVNKKRMIALAVSLFTASGVALYSALSPFEFAVAHANPQANPQVQVIDNLPVANTAAMENAASIDVVFVLDTTGSMGGMIDAAKEKIWSIASTLASADNTPHLRIGFVAYRDRGDAYVTKTVALSNDLDSAYAQLMDFRAEGGGDGPESVNKGLYDAVNSMSWSQNDSTYKAVFLVGDAPPHMDYDNEMTYPQIIKEAKRKGIVVNSILCGTDSFAATQWQTIAQLGYGKYFQVKQNGSAVAVRTPYDDKIALLAAKLDETRMYYGNEEDKRVYEAKVSASTKLKERSSIEAQARRGLFNSSAGGKANFAGDNDLLADLESGEVQLESIAEDELPQSLAEVPKPVRAQVVEETRERRAALKKEIQLLGSQRSEFLKQELAKRDDTKDSLDVQIWETIKEQTADKGIHYSADGPEY